MHSTRMRFPWYATTFAAAMSLAASALIAQSSSASARAAARAEPRRSNGDASARDADTTFAVAASGIVDITIRTGHLWVRGTDRTDAALWGNGC